MDNLKYDLACPSKGKYKIFHVDKRLVEWWPFV